MSTSLRGANLAGAEWAYTAGQTPVEGQQYLWVSHQDIDYLASKGVPFARLLFSWEILQPQLNGGLAVAYETAMRDRVSYATSQDMHVMIEPHGGEQTRFARYSDEDTFCVNVTLENPSDTADVDWEQMAIDLRGHTLQRSWNSAIVGSTGIVTVTPAADSRTVRARSKTSFGFCMQRDTKTRTKAQYQVLVKSLKW